jgi:hypothetical protein
VKGSPAVQVAARRILSGDDSISAANVLESAILLDHADDGDLDELVFALASYSPRGGHEYYGVDDLRAAIVDGLDVTNPSSYDR